MDGHQLSLAPRGGATGDRRPGAGYESRSIPLGRLRTATKLADVTRSPPTNNEEHRTCAAHDKCHCDTALQPSGLPENCENSLEKCILISCVLYCTVYLLYIVDFVSENWAKRCVLCEYLTVYS